MGSHFHGKDVLEHLKEARKKGHLASKEQHGIEAQGHLVGGADAAKELAIVLLLLWIVGSSLSLETSLLYHLSVFITVGLFFWKIGRSAALGWSRLERINKLIEDEREEIETNRSEEKQELTAMYAAKGFSEPLLSKVIDVLMADDNKLLGIMLEEELGVSLESYEHPLKQALGTGIGLFLSALFLLSFFLLFQARGIFVGAPLIIFIASAFMAKIESVHILPATVWNLAIAFLASGSAYFLTQFFLTK